VLLARACLTGETLLVVSEVSIRELRNHGGEVVDRAARGERIVITRDGQPVAELRGLERPPLPLEVVLEHMRGLPPIDADAFRRDVDSVVDQSL
jgi:prevent-host-death family protein